MKEVIKRILSQRAINNFYHLPKAVLANMMHGSPTRGMQVIGVTGTDGKTTTVNMIYQILKEAGKKVSMVSTINAIVGGKAYDTGFHVTSPGSDSLQKLAKMAKDHGDEYLVLEVTSHSLNQYRFWGVRFDVGVITNITHEHLDYHKTFQNYQKTKFKLLKGVKSAVINRNLKKYLESSEVSSKEILTFGISSGDFNQERIKLKLKIPGDYNIENALCALAVAFSLGIDRKIAQKVLESFAGIKGRMEEIGNKKGLKIIIDFAHTPNGLEQALKTLRLQTQGRLISLIGCEGYRDEGKRAMMGEIAKKLSDFVIVTAVDPRGQLDIINRQIIEGVKKAGAKQDRNLFIIDDREKAVNFAINSLAKRGDTLGIFGKGHEQSMNLDGKKEIPWSDSKVVEEVLG